MKKTRNLFKSICRVKNDNDTIPPEFSVCRVMKYLRHIKEMTQQDIEAAKAPDGKSLSQSYVSKIELMQTTPTFDMIFTFCYITKVDPQVFLDCVSQTMYMTNLEAAEYTCKKVLKTVIEKDA